MKRPTTIQQQESFTVAESTCPMQPNMDFPSVRQTGLEPVFEICGAPKARWAHRLTACVLPPTAIDAFLEQRHDIHAYRTSGRASDILSSTDARFAMAALTKSELNAIGHATLLASLDGKVG